MRSLSPRVYLALLWTSMCVALAGLAQVTAALVAPAPAVTAAPARHAPTDWLTPFTADGAPGPSGSPAAAGAAPPVAVAPPVALTELASRALARITYPWQRLGYQMVFAPGRPGLRGETVPSQHRIYIFLTPGEPESLVTHVIAHEIGHAVDFTYNDSDRRTRWSNVRGIDPGYAWFGCSGCADFATPAGDFAETFAYWQVRDADYSRLAAPPDGEQLRSLEPLFYPSAPSAAAGSQPAPPPQPVAPSAGGSHPSLLCVDAFCAG